MDFKQANEKFKQLKARFTAGELTEAEFKARLQDLMVQDEGGSWWMIGYETEKWYRYDGKDWVEDTPAANAAPGPVRQTPRPTDPVPPISAAAPSQRRRLTPVGIVGGLLLLILAFYIVPKWIRGAPATPSPIPGYYETQSAAFATEPPATEPPITDPGSILFQDDFSNPNSGWPVSTDNDTYTGYTADGQYLMRLFMVNQSSWVTYPGDYRDSRMQVQARATSDLGFYAFGLICRWLDDRNFYYFSAQSNGEFYAGKFQRGFQDIIHGKLAPGSIPANNTTLRLRADCIGDRLTFFVNGQQVGSLTDSTFTGGRAGLIMASFEKLNLEVAFDNFVVYKP